MFADRIKNISVSGIRKVFELGAKMKNPIDLSIGQPDFDVPEEIKSAAIQAIKKGYNRYTVTQGIPELRKQILENIRATKNVPLELDNVFLTSGVAGGMLLAFLVMLNPGDEVIIPDPYFVLYKHLTNLVGAVPKYYDLYPDFQLKADKIQALISPKTKFIILNSPSNPTGRVFDKQSLKKVVDMVKDRNIFLLSDEIYASFVYDVPYHSVYSFCPEKTILFDSFSKSYGMPGWRIGYVAAPKEIVDKMITLQQFSFVCTSSIAQYACIDVFKTDMSKNITAYKHKRDKIYQGLKKCGYDVECPEGSFYIYPRVPWGTDREFCEAAIQHEMLIIPGNTFSEKNTHFRISFATADKTIDRSLEVFAKLAKR